MTPPQVGACPEPPPNRKSPPLTARPFLFRHRDFGRFWLGMLLVNIAARIAAVMIGWKSYTIGRLTRSIGESAFLVGMVGLAQFVPLFFQTLYTGALADRMSRRTIVVAALVVETLSVIALVAVALDLTPGRPRSL